MVKTKINVGATIRQDYFQWLCEVANVVGNSTPYWLLAGYLHSKEFKTGKITNDENRIMDGISLREEYIRTGGVIGKAPLEDIYDSIDGPCSMLEFLVALARRIEFQLGDPDEGVDRTPVYFWEMCDNLGLTEYSDGFFVELDGKNSCDEIIQTLIKRSYQPNGYGGLFPLDNPPKDQRRVEIWSQMNSYIAERY